MPSPTRSFADLAFSAMGSGLAPDPRARPPVMSHARRSLLLRLVAGMRLTAKARRVVKMALFRRCEVGRRVSVPEVMRSIEASESTAKRALAECENHGFITRHRQSSKFGEDAKILVLHPDRLMAFCHDAEEVLADAFAARAEAKRERFLRSAHNSSMKSRGFNLDPSLALRASKNGSEADDAADAAHWQALWAARRALAAPVAPVGAPKVGPDPWIAKLDVALAQSRRLLDGS